MIRHPASYRDPAGYVFTEAGEMRRAVLPAYRLHYDWATEKGLFRKWMKSGKMTPFEEVAEVPAGMYKVLRPEPVAPWTYPAEWSFEQLRDAALLTLELNEEALAAGGILKDASMQNIQFVAGKPQLIDTLSVEKYAEGAGWKGFRQFCAEALYPLLLAHYLPHFSLANGSAHPRGLSAAFTAELLPFRARFSVSNWLYVFLPAALEKRTNEETKRSTNAVSTTAVLRNLAHLKRRIAALKPAGGPSDWGRYYAETILGEQYLADKEKTVGRWFSEQSPKSVLDLGCNTGVFSLLAAQEANCSVTALDSDAACIDRLYREAQARKLKNITALVADLTHPLAGGGWAGNEWAPLLERIQGNQLVLALALVHHLALALNVPLLSVMQLLHQLTARWVVVEWVPKEDPKAQILLRHREDIFEQYSQAHFEESLKGLFHIRKTESCAGSSRLLYLLEKSL